MKSAAALICALTFTGIVSPAMAAESQGNQGFVRAEIGRGELKIDDLGSDKDTTFGIGGGYWFNRNFAIEGGYNRLYDKGGDGASIKVNNFNLGGVAKKNFGADGNGFYLGGRLGYAYSSAKLRESEPGYSYSADVSSTGVYYGVNMGYDVNRNFGLGVNLTRYEAFDDAHVNNVGFSAEYRF